MDYFVRSGKIEKQSSACLVVGIFERRDPTMAARLIDTATDGAISNVMRRGDIDGKPGQTLLLQQPAGIEADRVLLVGLGKERQFDQVAYRKAISTSAEALQTINAMDAINFITQLPVKDRDCAWNIQQAVLITEDIYYRFDDCRGEKQRRDLPRQKLERYTFDVTRRADLPSAEKGLREALAISKGMRLAKNLGNLPGNICTPTYLADQAIALGKQYPIKTQIIDKTQMEKLGMGSLLSVARGSSQPPKLIVMEYLHGTKGEKPIALVGKGVTFDSGGISIKPAPQMDEMKFDMCGGASVFGALTAIAELKLPLNVVGIVAATENLVNGEATKPGDIVTSMAGITIEVLNTDAEGRLILCDALTYAEKFYDPRLCVDIATLTGACRVALGEYPSGLFTNTPALGRALLAAGEQIGDRAWQLPLWPEYEEHLRSEFADIANIPTKGTPGSAGTIIGATFLHRFTSKMKWAHLDICGIAWSGKKASGRPVPQLTQWLINQVRIKPAA